MCGGAFHQPRGLIGLFLVVLLITLPIVGGRGGGGGGGHAVSFAAKYLSPHLYRDNRNMRI